MKISNEFPELFKGRSYLQMLMEVLGELPLDNPFEEFLPAEEDENLRSE